jgi:hypothetical protein
MRWGRQRGRSGGIVTVSGVNAIASALSVRRAATVNPPADTPNWEIVALHDKAIPTQAEYFMAARAHAHVVTADSGHDVPQAAPSVVDSVILQAVSCAG